MDSEAGHPPRPLGRALLRSARPWQWTKNAVLLAPLLFARRAGDPGSVRLALSGVVAFSLAASAVYLANDVVDRERDRQHPLKRLRPVAAGELPPGVALAAAAALATLALALGSALGRGFLGCVGGYLALQLAYAWRLKRLVVVDVFAIAGGFVLRVVAGAEAIAVPVSNWLYLCTLLLALFLALEKRRAEIGLLGEAAPEHRGALGGYDRALLGELSSIAASTTLLAYALYTLAPETVQKFGTDRLKFTVPFVLFGLFRYLFLTRRKGEGGAPERVLARDRPTQANLLGYLTTVVWALYTRA